MVSLEGYLKEPLSNISSLKMYLQWLYQETIVNGREKHLFLFFYGVISYPLSISDHSRDFTTVSYRDKRFIF